jgi:hypothetical protein
MTEGQKHTNTSNEKQMSVEQWLEIRKEAGKMMGSWGAMNLGNKLAGMAPDRRS